MASNRLFLNEKTVKKDGTTVVYALVHIGNKSIKINTGISVALDQWDKQKGRIIGIDQNTNDSNLIIDRCLSSINQIFVRYRLQNRILTADLLLQEYNNPTLYIDFYAYMDKKILERVRTKEIGSVSGIHQRVLLNKLKKFKSYLSFAEIDMKFIIAFRNWCRITENNSVNTIQKTLGYFRAYLNIAKREEIISVNPFDNIQLKRIDVQRVYLTEIQLNKLTDLYKSGEIEDNLQKTLRHFLFMCYTGIRISDFKRLKMDNVQENTLKFIPHKTNSKKRLELHIPLIEQAKKLIHDESSQSDFLFDSITEQKMNDQLKSIVAIAGIKKAVTNHSARHTFASLFLEKTSDIATLQKILGHSDIKETMLYVHISNKKIDNQMTNFGNLLNS